MEHTVGETSTMGVSRKGWYVYTWSYLHLLPVILLLDTHNISFPMQEAASGEQLSDMSTWKKMKQKKLDLSEPQPSLPKYYGTAETDLDAYCTTFSELYPEVDDPLEQETDETALILSGHGMEHGRPRVLSAVVRPGRTLTQVKATIPAGTTIPPPRQPRQSRDVSLSHYHPLSDIPSCMANLTRFIIF